MAEKENIVDKIVDDNTKITLKSKSVKWIMGILISGVITIMSTAFGLYLNTESNRKVDKAEIQLLIKNNHIEVLDVISKMENKKVDPNTTKIYSHDTQLGILLDRTNSRESSINGNTARPENLNILPPPQ